MTARGAILLVGTLIFASTSCERDALLGFDSPARSDAEASDASIRTTADAAPVCHPAPCGNHVYACGDCLDNDGDGKVDMEDPDCLGPCQNSESTFFGSIPGQNHAPCTQDCYFDQDTGSGNDDCLWSHACDPLSIAPDYPPEGSACPYDAAAKLPKDETCAEASASQSAQCLTVCGPLTPNGCDCFGCCAIPGAPTPVWLGSTDALGNPSCDSAHAADPSRCKPCTQVAGCLNPCETCELCVGKRELPASCAPTPAPTCTAPACANGPACGLDCLPQCPAGEACVTGCCVDARIE